MTLLCALLCQKARQQVAEELLFCTCCVAPCHWQQKGLFLSQKLLSLPVCSLEFCDGDLGHGTIDLCKVESAGDGTNITSGVGGD